MVRGRALIWHDVESIQFLALPASSNYILILRYKVSVFKIKLHLLSTFGLIKKYFRTMNKKAKKKPVSHFLRKKSILWVSEFLVTVCKLGTQKLIHHPIFHMKFNALFLCSSIDKFNFFFLNFICFDGICQWRSVVNEIRFCIFFFFVLFFHWQDLSSISAISAEFGF